MRAENGGYGKNNYGSIFEQPVIGRRSEVGMLRVTDDKPLPGQHKPTPYVFIGDEAFPLKHYVMWP